MRLLPIHSDIARFQIRKIDPGDNFPMHQHQQPIAGKKIRKDRILFCASHQLVHRVDHGLEPLQPLDTIHHGRLAHVNAERSTGDGRPHMTQKSPPRISR